MTPENETKLRLAIIQQMLDNKEAVMRNKLYRPNDRLTRGYNERMMQEEIHLQEWLKLMDEKP